MEPTLDALQASPTTQGGTQQSKPPSQRHPKPPKPRAASAQNADVVDLGDATADDTDTPTPEPRKRSHTQMEAGHGVYYSPRQFKRGHQDHTNEPSRRNVGGERQRSNSTPSARPSPTPPEQPLRVKPIQSRSPSPERAIILGPPTPVPHVPKLAPKPKSTPLSTNESAGGEQDVAARLRKERQAFYGKAASLARANVKMETAKPSLRPPMQPPGLFHLLPCGLLKVDLELGSFPVFQDEVHKWKNDPSCMDRLFASYGRFYSPAHQVHSSLITVFPRAFFGFHLHARSLLHFNLDGLWLCHILSLANLSPS